MTINITLERDDMLQNASFSEQYLYGNDSEIQSTVDPTIIFGPHRDSLYLVIPITIIYSVIFLTGLLGNMFTCIVIIRNKSMHTATNYYLFSLAVSDLLLLVSGMPQEMYSIWSKWPYVFGAAFCLIRGLAAETSTNASILTITLFTIERYLAICHPFQSHKMSKLSRATKHVLLLWAVSFTLALPQALQFGLTTHRGVVMCLQTRVIIEHSFEISTFLLFLAPIILISVLYFLIGLKLKESDSGRMQKHSARSAVPPLKKVHRRHSSATRKVVKMLVAVVVAFFICWAPFHAQRLVAIYGTTESHHARSNYLLFAYHCLTYISGIFYYLSTCINPILYHIMSNKFRDAFKNTMLWCCSPRKRGQDQRPYGAHVFARVPTFSGSENSGNNNYRKDSREFFKKQSSFTIQSENEKNKKTSVNLELLNKDKKQQCFVFPFQFPMKNNTSAKLKDKEITIQNDPIAKTINTEPCYNKDQQVGENQTENAEKIKPPPSTISNSSLKEMKPEDLKDELSTYLNDMKDRNADKGDYAIP